MLDLKSLNKNLQKLNRTQTQPVTSSAPLPKKKDDFKGR